MNSPNKSNVEIIAQIAGQIFSAVIQNGQPGSWQQVFNGRDPSYLETLVAKKAAAIYAAAEREIRG